MEIYFLCIAESCRRMNEFGVAGGIRSQDQYDYRPGIIAGTVWEKDQYDHGTPVSSRD
jgi:hypothetical protein